MHPASCFGLLGSQGKLRWPSLSFPVWLASIPCCPHYLYQRNPSWSRCFRQFLKVTVFALVRPLLQLVKASLITLFRPWAVGLVLPTCCTFALYLRPWLHSLLISSLAWLVRDAGIHGKYSYCPLDQRQLTRLPGGYFSVPLAAFCLCNLWIVHLYSRIARK